MFVSRSIQNQALQVFEMSIGSVTSSDRRVSSVTLTEVPWLSRLWGRAWGLITPEFDSTPRNSAESQCRAGPGAGAGSLGVISDAGIGDCRRVTQTSLPR